MGKNSVLSKAIKYIESSKFKNDVVKYRWKIPRSVVSERHRFTNKIVTTKWKYLIVRLNTDEGKKLSVNFVPDPELTESKIVIMIEFLELSEDMTYTYPAPKDLNFPCVYQILFFDELSLPFREKFKNIPEKDEKGRYLFFESGSLTKGVR